MISKKDTNEAYHSSSAISASGLKTIYLKSMYHYLFQKPFESKAMAFGSAVHSALLEPKDFDDEYYIMPKLDRRTKEGQAIYKERLKFAADKKILTKDEGDKINEIIKNFKKNSLANKYAKGEIELSHYGKYNDIDVRIRPDVLNRKEDFISDVKTCQDNSPIAFKRDIYKYAYHLQATFYMDMLGINNFKFIAVQNTYPYTVEVYTLGEELLERGRNAWKQAFKDYEIYKETQVITSYNWHLYDNDGSFVI